MACSRSRDILWLVATASSLPFESRSVDVITAMFSLIQPEEYARVLKDGGWFYLGKKWDLDVNAVIFEDGYDHVVAKRKDWMVEESMNRNKSNVEFADKERFCQNDVPKIEFHYEEDKYEDLMRKIEILYRHLRVHEAGHR